MGNRVAAECCTLPERIEPLACEGSVWGRLGRASAALSEGRLSMSGLGMILEAVALGLLALPATSPAADSMAECLSANPCAGDSTWKSLPGVTAAALATVSDPDVYMPGEAMAWLAAGCLRTDSTSTRSLSLSASSWLVLEAAESSALVSPASCTCWLLKVADIMLADLLYEAKDAAPGLGKHWC